MTLAILILLMSMALLMKCITYVHIHAIKLIVLAQKMCFAYSLQVRQSESVIKVCRCATWLAKATYF